MSLYVKFKKFLTSSYRKLFIDSNKENFSPLYTPQNPRISLVSKTSVSSLLTTVCATSLLNNKKEVYSETYSYTPHNSPLYHRNGGRDAWQSRNPLQGLSYQNRTCYH